MTDGDVTKPSPQLAAIYCRVSSERQEKERTIQSQLAELETIAKVNADVVVERYLDDGYSGELLERPALDKLRNDASKHLFSKIYILSPDRLARKHHYAAIILEDLARCGVKIIFSNRPLGESVEDRLLFNIQSVFADYEKAKILDRLRRGKLFKMKQGNVLGNAPPYGYDYRKDENRRKAWYEVNKQEAEVVRFIFSFYTSGECSGLLGVRRELYKRNIKTRGRSNKWSQSMVARILRNETYIGTTHWGKYRSVERTSHTGYRRLKNTARVRRPYEEWLPIKVPPIIDESLFAAAANVRARNKQLSVSNVKYAYLLKGVIRCQVCNSLMYSKSCHGVGYYVCSKKRRAFPSDVVCTNARHFRSEPLDHELWDEFRRIVLSPPVLLERIRQKSEGRAKANQDMNDEIDGLRSHISMLKEKRNKVVDVYTDGVITIGELRKRSEELDKQIKMLDSQQDTLIVQRATLPDDKPEQVKVEEFSAQIKEILETVDFGIKQRIVRQFVNQISLSKEEARVSASLPRSLSCVPTSTVSLQHEQRYTGYPFEFVIKVPSGRHRTASL